MVRSVIEIRTRFAQRRDRETRSLQRSRVVFEGLRPTGEMHLQGIAFLHAFEAVPAEISVFNNKGGVRLCAGEAATVRKWMADRNDQPPRRTHDTPDFDQCARDVIDVHQDVVSHDKIELGICKWKSIRCRDRIMTGGLSLGGSLDKVVDG